MSGLDRCGTLCKALWKLDPLSLKKPSTKHPITGRAQIKNNPEIAKYMPKDKGTVK